jgi:hypothetical protein
MSKLKILLNVAFVLWAQFSVAQIQNDVETYIVFHKNLRSSDKKDLPYVHIAEWLPISVAASEALSLDLIPMITLKVPDKRSNTYTTMDGRLLDSSPKIKNVIVKIPIYDADYLLPNNNAALDFDKKLRQVIGENPDVLQIELKLITVPLYNHTPEKQSLIKSYRKIFFQKIDRNFRLINSARFCSILF